MFGKTREEVAELKAKYPVGTLVQLEYMSGEPQMLPRTKGRVDCVDDIGQIHVHWENGSSLALNTDTDRFSVLERPEEERDDR